MNFTISGGGGVLGTNPPWIPRDQFQGQIYMWISNCMRVSTPNSHFIQGSTVYTLLPRPCLKIRRPGALPYRGVRTHLWLTAWTDFSFPSIPPFRVPFARVRRTPFLMLSPLVMTLHTWTCTHPSMNGPTPSSLMSPTHVRTHPYTGSLHEDMGDGPRACGQMSPRVVAKAKVP